jgi:hypothetical protein
MEEHKTIQKIMAAQGTVEEETDGDGTSRWAWGGRARRDGTKRDGTAKRRVVWTVVVVVVV